MDRSPSRKSTVRYSCTSQAKQAELLGRSEAPGTALSHESSLQAGETKIYPETSIPRSLFEWNDSQDGKVSVCFAVDKTAFTAKEPITVRCAVRNLGDKPINILRPFGDPYGTISGGLSILGPDGVIPYRGGLRDYLLGASSYIELPAHTVVDETFVIPTNVFTGFGKAGLYTISYEFISIRNANYPQDPPPANSWEGRIKTTPLTFVVN
jgi:hypothetical protein